VHHQMLLAATVLATTAGNSKHFRIGPWIIVPILILAAIIAIPIYLVKDRRRRQRLTSQNE
jgi:4-hydroxybenzoate polyprenyltransferase